MINEHKSFNRFIRKKIISIVTLIMLLILFLASIVFIINHDNKNQAVLINTFGKQRMLTQMIAKDINRKYTIMLSLQQGPLVEDKKTFNDKITLLNHSLDEAQKEFKIALLSLHSGKLSNNDDNVNFESSLNEISPIVVKMDKVWEVFNKSVDDIIDSEKIDKNAAEAISYINTHNEELMNYCDDITQTVVNIQKQDLNIDMLLAFILFVAVIVLLFISLFQLQKYIVLPLNELYEGIKSMGMLKINNKKIVPTKNKVIPIITEINESLNKFNKLIELLEHINKDMSFDETLNYIYKSFSSFIPYSHIGIALLKDDGKVLEASYGISGSSLGDLPKKLLGIKAEFSKTSLENIILNGKPRVINDLAEYTKNSVMEYNKILLKAGIKASITLPLKINNAPIGIIFFSSIEKNIYNEEHVIFLSSLANSIAISFNKNIFIDELLYSSVLALAKMSEARDEDTGEHLERMKRYSKLISELLFEDHIYEDTISIRFIKDVERYSPMHDIGKVGVKDGILLKPGKLTAEEFEEMKKHAIYGAEVLSVADNNIKKQNISLFKVGIEIAESHHEKWDGSGYPYGKIGEAIPLSARIVAVADVFDALTSKRPYKKAFSFEESFNIVIEGRGKHFDPYIIDTFIKHKKNIYELYKGLWV